MNNWSIIVLLFAIRIHESLANTNGSALFKSNKRGKWGSWKLIWADEFDRKLEKSKWSYQFGNGCQYGICGWGNGEHQYYTSSRRNVQVKSGRLIIKAREEKNSRLKELRKRCKSDCKKDAACQSRCDQIYISSGRVRSFKKFDIAPGMKGYSAIKVSAKIKASPGIGIWPALWMLPTGSDDKCSGCGHYGTWAASGEIDIFESVNNMDEALGTIHYGGPWPENVSSGNKTSIKRGNWNIVSFIWREDSMEWYMNGEKFFTASSGNGRTNGWYSKASPTAHAPFDKPFHLLVNVAVGGGLTGNVGLDQALDTLKSGPKTLHVDYIRVFALK